MRSFKETRQDIQDSFENILRYGHLVSSMILLLYIIHNADNRHVPFLTPNRFLKMLAALAARSATSPKKARRYEEKAIDSYKRVALDRLFPARRDIIFQVGSVR